MRLSYSIPIITWVFLIFTAIVNIWAFQVFSDKYFSEYIEELAKTDVSPDPNRIQALLQIGKLNKDDQAEYITILSELSNLATSLENISENPELYMSNTSATGGSMISLPFIENQKNLVPSFRLSAISEGTLEGEFVRNILRDILLVNIAWLSLLLIGYSLWIRSLFRPIIVVTSTLQNIIDRRHYASIRYSANNEFTPLISTINNLHKSLSIQEKIRSDFLSDLSHEIRTPVTAVKCYLEAIQDGAMELDTNTVNLLQSELERLAHITGRIMDYESLTHDVFDAVNVERFSLKKVSLDIINEYKPQLMKTNQVIDIDFPDDTMTSMDKGMYIQVLHNIISNFIKYAWENTRLLIGYKKNVKDYIFEFSDNGVGIPNEELEYVKEKFYRVDKARTQSEKSMGIGLSIIDKIARLHGGSLTVEENTPKWVKFIVRVGR